MDYKVISKESFNVAGIRKVTENPGGVWAIVKQDGSMEKMKKLAGEDKVTLGLCFGFNENGQNDNMVGFKTNEEKLKDYEVYKFPKSDWIEVVVEGKISDNVLWNAWQYIHKELIDKKVINQRDVPTIEDYIVWDESIDYCKVIINVEIN